MPLYCVMHHIYCIVHTYCIVLWWWPW